MKNLLICLLLLLSPLYGQVKDTIIIREGYTLCYSEQHEQARWVSYKINKYQLMAGSYKRKNNFKFDNSIRTGSASPKDYRWSGYDRGHLAPAADMAWSEKTMRESFYMSNMSPQKPRFNRGIWKKLEGQVRDWVRLERILYVITGPILTDSLPTIGMNKVSVPEYFFKAILDNEEPEIKTIAFLIPNENSKKPLQQYIITVDSLKTLTGIDFFPMILDSVKKELFIDKWRF